MDKIECPSCGAYNTLDEAKCWKCKRLITDEEKAAHISELEQTKKLEEQEAKQKEWLDSLPPEQKAIESIQLALKTGDWSIVSTESLEIAAKSVTVTTSNQLGSGQPYSEVDVISVEVVFGMNIFKEVFKSIRDLVGGRSKTVEKLMRESRKTALNELRKEAVVHGANAVIAVDLDYVEIGSSDGMIMLVANGTAVRVGE